MCTYQVTIEAKSGTGKGRSSTVVGSGHATGDDGVTPLLEGIGQEELELAHLVAGERGTSVVVALDEQLDIGAVFIEGLEEPGLDLRHSGHELFSGHFLFQANFR